MAVRGSLPLEGEARLRRDMELVREILRATEDAGPEGFTNRECRFPERDDVEVAYHVRLLSEAGMLEGIVADSESGLIGAYRVDRLTWAGHEFLDAARDPKLWAAAKAKIGASLSSVSVELLKTVLVELGKATILGPGAP